MAIGAPFMSGFLSPLVFTDGTIVASFEDGLIALVTSFDGALAVIDSASGFVSEQAIDGTIKEDP